jgi:hypothetical protein
VNLFWSAWHPLDRFTNVRRTSSIWIQLLEENVKYPVNVGPDASEFQSTAFGSINPFDSSGNIFASRYDSGFGTASTFQVDGQGPSDMDAFLASLAPPKGSTVGLQDSHPFPNSPGIPIGCFQDRSPDSPSEITFDNYAMVSFDSSATGAVQDLFGDDKFQAGGAIILKTGTYPGPIVVDKDVSLRADGAVYIQSTGVGLVVEKGARLVIEGIGFLAGSDFVVTDGSVQILRCAFAATLQVKGDSIVSCRNSDFQNATTWGAVVSDKARVAFVETTFTGRGVYLTGGDLSMLDCRIDGQGVYDNAVRVERGMARFDRCAFSEFVKNVIEIEGHSDVIISQSSVAHSQEGHLINVTRGALVKVKQTELTGSCKTAIVASNGSTVSCEDLTVNKPVVCGTSSLLRLKRCKTLTVFVNSARLNMQDCQVENAPRTAVVGVGTSDLHIEGSHFTDCSSNAIEVTGQTAATIIRTRFRTSRGAGAGIQSHSANLRHCAFVGNTVGCQLTGEGLNVSFEQCSFADNLSAAVTVLDGAAPKFSRCTFLTNEHLGVVLSGTKVAFEACEFKGSKGPALFATAGALPSLANCVFDSNTSFAAQITGRGTIAAFEKCAFKLNQPASAVVITSKAAATFKATRFDQNGLFHVEIRDEDSSVRFEEQCQLTGSTGGIGIFAHDGCKIELDKCGLWKEPKTPVYVGMRARATVWGHEQISHLI